MNRLSVLLLPLLLVGACLPAAGEEPSAPEADRSVHRLVEFHSGETPVRLSGRRSELSLGIPLAATERMLGATVEFRLVHSIALVRGTSGFTLRFNDVTVGQVRVDPEQPELRIAVELPAELWRPGFNTLTLEAVQASSERCAAPDSPELWSEVDLYRSRLDVRTAPADAPLVLSDLASLFGPGLGAHASVQIASGNGWRSGGTPGQALAAVAEALALHRRYRPLAVRHGPLPERPPGRSPGETAAAPPWIPPELAERGGGALVLVGRREELAGVLEDRELEAIDDAFLALHRIPRPEVEGVPALVRLVVSGTSDEEVLRAAQALAELEGRFAQRASLRVAARESERSGRLAFPSDVLRPSASYRFAELGQDDLTFRGAGAFRRDLRFELPPDFYVGDQATVHWSLDFAYGANPGIGSTVNFLLNGELLHGLPLNEASGASYRAYRIDVPARKLRPGSNRFSVEVSLQPQSDGLECSPRPARHLVFQLLGSSRIELPEAASVTLLPDLGLLGDTGYPFAAGSGTEARIVALEDAALGAALTLAGRLAQAAGGLLEGVPVGRSSAAAGAEHRLLVGRLGALPPDLFDAWRAALGRSVRWPARALNDWRSLARGEAPAFVGHLLHEGSIGGHGALAMLPSGTTGRSGTTTLAVAESTALLEARLRDLAAAPLWGQLHGDLFLWRDREEPVFAVRVQPGVLEGPDEHAWPGLRLWLSNNPGYWVLALVVAVLALTLLVSRSLRRRQRALQHGSAGP